MAEPQTVKVRALIHDVFSDARSLIRDEITLARAEMREQTVEAKGLGMLFGGALALAITGMALLFAALALGIAIALSIPAWAAFAGMGVVVGFAGYLLFTRGQSATKQMSVLPKTKASIQENIAWLQSKSNSR